ADRFGPLPPQAEAFVQAARVRQLARADGVARVDAGPAAIALTPRDGHEVDGKAARLTKSGDRWLLKEALPDEAARMERLAGLLEALAP
ncbi:TRCF domain-containing protein, partial [Salmonella sp. SAL4435]|uniref:TRCF domain-containing protein n=1 Tax=Salmonella sp. SAL4435 TaxID=3159890 RepID=UPI00397A1C81